jgi:hypothetical protein
MLVYQRVKGRNFCSIFSESPFVFIAAGPFKQVNPVSPIDLREFGEKPALSLDWHI